MTAYQSYLDAHDGRFLAELLDFLRIPASLPYRSSRGTWPAPAIGWRSV